jgi:hypothetical protein
MSTNVFRVFVRFFLKVLEALKLLLLEDHYNVGKYPDNNRRPRRLSFSFMLDLPISQITDVKKHGSYNLQISIKREKDKSANDIY